MTKNILTVDVTATTLIALGTGNRSTSTIVSASASTVTNAGNETVTYSLSLANPGGLDAVQAAPGAGEYCLSAMFSTVQPAAGSFELCHNHALATGAPGPACSATQLATALPGRVAFPFRHPKFGVCGLNLSHPQAQRFRGSRRSQLR